MREITSTQNPKIKHILQLQKKSAVRKKHQAFVVEGKRELRLAVHNHYEIQSVLYDPQIIEENEIMVLMGENFSEDKLIKVSKNVYQKLAYRPSTEGVIAVASMKSHRFEDINLSKNPYLLVAEQVEKPGNIGAMLRTVDGANADAFVLVDPVVDIYNPNVIRSSLGTIFSNQIVLTNLDELQGFLSKNGIHLYCATLQNANKYFLKDYTKPTAIAVGAEDKGLSEAIREMGEPIYIPMLGQADSLNVSVSAAVLLYEVVRQRNPL